MKKIIATSFFLSFSSQISYAIAEYQKELTCQTNDNGSLIFKVFSNNNFWLTEQTNGFQTTLSIDANSNESIQHLLVNSPDLSNQKKYFFPKKYTSNNLEIKLKTKIPTNKNPETSPIDSSNNTHHINDEFYYFVAEELDYLTINYNGKYYEFNQHSNCNIMYSVNDEVLKEFNAYYYSPIHISPERLETSISNTGNGNTTTFIISKLYSGAKTIDLSSAMPLNTKSTKFASTIKGETDTGITYCHLLNPSEAYIGCLHYFKEKPIPSSNQISLSNSTSNVFTSTAVKRFSPEFLSTLQVEMPTQPDGILEIKFPLSVEFMHLFGLSTEQQLLKQKLKSRRFNFPKIPLSLSHDGLIFVEGESPVFGLLNSDILNTNLDQMFYFGNPFLIEGPSTIPGFFTKPTEIVYRTTSNFYGPNYKGSTVESFDMKLTRREVFAPRNLFTGIREKTNEFFEGYYVFARNLEAKKISSVIEDLDYQSGHKKLICSNSFLLKDNLCQIQFEDLSNSQLWLFNPEENR